VSVLDLGPLSRAAGTVRLPGSKSISNRVLLLAALAQGETKVGGLLDAEDTQVMRAALGKLGAQLGAKQADLFLGNAGTAFRPLTAVLALAGGEYRLSGTPRMHERPIGDLVDALRALGARIDYLGAEGYPPLAIHPGKVAAGQTVRVRGDVSSQYLSALLMALPLAGGGGIEVEGELISKPYVEITLNLLQRFGIEVRRTGWRSFAVPGSR
jgi:3-phosphoshikimate 1-carboxyvinyltransferase